jgi:hypothetical protein
MSCNAPIFVLYLEMAQEVLEDEVPCVLKMAFEELWSPEGTTNNVATDAFGMADNILSETSVPFCRYHLTKDMVIAELDNLEHYEKVQRDRNIMNTPLYVIKVLATGVSSLHSVPFWPYKTYLRHLVISYKHILQRPNQSLWIFTSY